MEAPQLLADALSTYGYHPRSNKHSNALCHAIVADLLDSCPAFARDAATGKIVRALNHDVNVGNSRWNIDLAVGPPAGTAKSPAPNTPFALGVPSTIQIAIEAKSILTEHRKAMRNRQRDLLSYQSYMHRFFPDSVIAGVGVFNISNRFFSPLRNVKTTCPNCGHVFQPMSLTNHADPKSLVTSAISLFRDLSLRSRTSEVGFDAIAVLVVAHENTPGAKCRLLTRKPAPQVGDPLHYDAFLKRVCECYTRRFGA